MQRRARSSAASRGSAPWAACRTRISLISLVSLVTPAAAAPVKNASALLADIETADVDERMRPLLSYVGKVTREPARVSPADARRVLDAGWDEHALHDAVSVCAPFNFMNRFVSGLGVSDGEEYFDVSGNRLANHGYAGLKTML